MATGNAGQVLISNGASADPTFQDPIVSSAYTNLFNATSATATATSSTVRVSTFGGFGTLYVTYASITGSPSGCTLQLKNADSLGNLINNGAAISTTPANGTTTAAVNSGANLQTTAQMQAVYACSTYPTAGSLSLDYVPGLAVGLLAPLPTGANTIGAVTQASGPWTSNLTQIGGNAIASDGAGTQRVQAKIWDGTNTQAVKAASTAAAAADASAVVALSPNSPVPTGSNVIGGVTQSGTWTVQPGNTPNTTPWLSTQTPATSGGLTLATGTVGATVTAVKASAGQLYGWYLFNSNSTTAYCQLFNAATGGVTLGTTAPTLSFGIPPLSGANLEVNNGLAFGTAISVAFTTTRSGSTGPTNTIDYNFWFK